MSIDIEIRQRGLFKKAMPLETILGPSLWYGRMEGVVLKEGERGEKEFLAYDPLHIGRGIGVEWTPEEKERVTLRALTPTLPEEIEELFAAVKRMTDCWNCELEVDGQRQRPAEFMARLPEMLEFNEDTLVTMARKVCAGEYGVLQMPSAKWLLNIGPAQAERFVREPDAFYRWLHERQSIDAYYATPRFFRVEGGIEGKFVLNEDTRSIFPKKPAPPYGMVDPETGKALECDRYEVMLYIFSTQKLLGQLPYERFLQAIEGKAEEYDGGSWLLEGQSAEALEAMLDGEGEGKEG